MALGVLEKFGDKSAFLGGLFDKSVIVKRYSQSVRQLLTDLSAAAAVLSAYGDYFSVIVHRKRLL